jgi:hypothetical protein
MTADPAPAARPTPSLPRLRRGLPDAALFAEAWLALALARVALRAWPLRRVARALGALWAIAPRGAARHDAPRAVGAIAGAAARCHPGSTCVPRAVAAQILLRRRGHRAEVRMGFRRDGRRLLGHAWVEVDGRRVAEPAGEVWAPLSAPASAPTA